MKDLSLKNALSGAIRCSQMLTCMAGILISAVGLFGQDAPLKPPDPLPDVPYPSALDSKQVGQQSPVPDSQVVANTSFLDGVDVDVARWQEFLEQARQEVAALEGSSDPKNRTEAARLKQIIPMAEDHLQALLAKQKLQQDMKDCGLTALKGDWENLKQFADQEHQRMETAATSSEVMKAQGAGIFSTVLGATGTSMIATGANIMKRQMEMDADAAARAESEIENIVTHCIEKQARQREEESEKDAQKRWRDFKSKVVAANPVANQKAQEARALAKSGQYKDEAKIRELLTTVLIVARANQLLGNEEGFKQQKEAQNAAIDFVNAFASDCMNQAVPLAAVAALDHINQGLAMNVDLSMCYNRVYEAIGMTGYMLPYRFRHCGPDLSGEWKMQVTRGTVNGTFGKLEGATTVPALASAGSSTGSMPLLNTITTNHFESAPAHIEASGRMGDREIAPSTMRVDGDFTIFVDISVASPGIVLHRDMKMNAAIKGEGFNATPAKGGMTTHVPAMAGQSLQTPIGVINGNRPCDPSKDVFSYPTDR